MGTKLRSYRGVKAREWSFLPVKQARRNYGTNAIRPVCDHLKLPLRSREVYDRREGGEKDKRIIEIPVNWP